MTKHKNDFVLTEWSEVARIQRSAFCKNVHPVTGEDGEVACWQVTEAKKNINDSKPVHLGVAILQYSKLLFIRYALILSNFENEVYLYQIHDMVI